MKKSITSAAAVAILTVAGISQAHAWGFGDVFSDKKQTNQSSGRDSTSMGKNSAGRDRFDFRNSFNRTNSPDVSNSRNFVTGTVSTGGNVMQSAGQVRDIGNGTAKNARFGLGGGNFKNSGLIGNNAGASIVTGGITVGDSNNYGNSYMGTDALNTQVQMRKLDQEVELKKIEAASR